MTDDAIFFICATVLFVLFYGEPDLMDTMQQWVAGECTVHSK